MIQDLFFNKTKKKCWLKFWSKICALQKALIASAEQVVNDDLAEVQMFGFKETEPVMTNRRERMQDTRKLVKNTFIRNSLEIWTSFESHVTKTQ